MKWIYKITIFLFLLVLLTAEDCGNNSVETMQVKSPATIFEELQKEMETSEPEEFVLLAYEKQGIQELKDFADYLNIYADSSLNIQFRKQAKQMINDKFSSNNQLQNIFYKLDLSEDQSKTLVLKSDRIFKMRVDSIEVSKPLQHVQNFGYLGELQFQLLFQNNTEFLKTNYRMQITAVKTSKPFGDELLDVWNVYLGELSIY